MQKSLTTLLALFALAVGTSACMQERSAINQAPGSYESSTKTTNSAGTTTKTKTSTDVTVDEYGNKKAVVETKKSTDPKGLFNKSTSKSKAVIEEDRY